MLLALELIAYFALGLWLERRGWGDIEIAILMVCSFVALRAGLLGFGYAYLIAYPSRPAKPLGAFATLRMVILELVAWIVLFSMVQPFERLWMGRDRLRPNAGELPLLLVHGYRCNRGFWIWLRARLEAAGHVVATYNLEPVWADIDDYADGLERRIDEVLAATKAEKLVLIAHSMGGLAARAYFRRHGTAKVARMVSLGSPHHGTRIAAHAHGANGRQMRVGNPWLEGLDKAPLPADSVSIFSRHDNVVMPPDQVSPLAGARNVEIGGIGHVGMALSPTVLQLLLKELG